ncbi:hypothetical protein [Sorangium sp. So ce1099]|uniref:hypothetical protein n=1 Tax=Sorangium sp. So ce1099 TaxID=3133331 RepID=UPI003F5E65AB
MVTRAARRRLRAHANVTIGFTPTDRRTSASPAVRAAHADGERLDEHRPVLGGRPVDVVATQSQEDP